MINHYSKHVYHWLLLQKTIIIVLNLIILSFINGQCESSMRKILESKFQRQLNSW